MLTAGTVGPRAFFYKRSSGRHGHHMAFSVLHKSDCDAPQSQGLAKRDVPKREIAPTADLLPRSFVPVAFLPFTFTSFQIHREVPGSSAHERSGRVCTGADSASSASTSCEGQENARRSLLCSHVSALRRSETYDLCAASNRVRYRGLCPQGAGSAKETADTSSVTSSCSTRLKAEM